MVWFGFVSVIARLEDTPGSIVSGLKLFAAEGGAMTVSAPDVAATPGSALALYTASVVFT